MTQSNARNGTDDGIVALSQRCRTTNGYPNDDAHAEDDRTSPGSTYRTDLVFSAGVSPHDTPMPHGTYERYKQSERDEQSKRSEPATNSDRRGAR